MRERYDVFLSYSHEDAKLYGQEIIGRIKREIQDELRDFARRPLVFLDTEALRYGDEWHAKIMEKIDECKIFICLLSPNYLESPYCTRERIWWARKETRNGRLRRDTCPVYFVQMDLDPWQNPSARTKDLFGFQLEQKELTLVPWFRGKEEVKELFIQERLDFLKNSIAGKLQDRDAGNESFCSVTPRLSENFVGRILELKELREICVSGRFPVIQAAGGVGKTELAAAYAFGYAEEYPMGRFLIRMEGIGSWQEALVSMLNDSKTGRKTREYLGISEEEMSKPPEALHILIVRKLFELTKRGRLLLLLDNVDDGSLFTGKKLEEFSPEGDPIPRELHMVATARHRLDYPGNSRAQAMPLDNLAPDEAFELFCTIGGKLFPCCMKADTGNDPESAALREIIALLDGHVWALEILAGYMAKNYANGMTFVRKLEALKKDFIVKGENSYRNTDNSPALLEPTFSAVKALALGDAVINLLYLAALLDPDAVSVDALEGCWNKYYGDLEFEDGSPFAYALNTLKEYCLLNGSGPQRKIHRLTQGAVKALLGNALPEYAATLASVLEKPPSFSQQDWCRALMTTPELYECCSGDFRKNKFSLRNWEHLLVVPELVKYCPWDKLTGPCWSGILRKFPQFGSRCRWEKLAGDDWMRLLRDRPQFADKCRWKKLDGSAWGRLLRKQPRFADRCPWEELDGFDWCRLLKYQPQFADKCQWDKLSGADWSLLLSAWPQFADKCDWDKLSGSDWCSLLIDRPQFADKCDWDKLDGLDWSSLLRRQPRFADKCRWDKLSSLAWRMLLRSQPQFADRRKGCQPPEDAEPPAGGVPERLWKLINDPDYDLDGSDPDGNAPDEEQ